ncbi:MAG: patatin-like phospholipase family protein [Terracidiphilus sp.]
MPIRCATPLCPVLLALLLPLTAAAQQAQPGARPQVGLVLSGGSALGLAHIGVIRYFEEHRIPIDRIGGTSMGGLVGGLYAGGMDSSQIQSVVADADWNALLNPSPQFQDQPIVDKQEWNRTFGDLTFRFGKGFSLPPGLNPGEALSLLLSRLTLADSGISDFDQLPTPFRCVATDLVSGGAVVLSKGSLPVAMRATMSLPGVFTPVKLDRMVLVDGGVLENIPVDAVRGMGATFVIAVQLETPNPRPDQIKSLSDVLQRTISVAISDNEKRSLAKADLVIAVDTSRFSAADFEQWKELEQAGYEAAKAHASQLAPYALSQQDWDAYLALRRARMRPAGQRGKVLEVSAPDPSFQKNAQFEVRRALDDKPVSERQLEKTLSDIVSTTTIPGAAYSWDQNSAGLSGYDVSFAERPTDQLLARVSGQYAVSPGEPSRFEVKFSTVMVPQNAYKARLLTAASLGFDPGLQTEFYKPFGGSEHFIAPQFFVGRTHFESYAGSARQSNFRDRVGGAFYTGTGTWRFAQLRLGAQAGYDSYSASVVTEGVPSRDGGFVQPELRWILNTENSGGMPTHGVRVEGSAGYAFRRAVDYPFLQNEASAFEPLNRHITFFALNHTGTGFGRKLDYYDQFTSGDVGDMAAFRYQEFHSDSLVTAGSGLILNGPTIPPLSSHPGIALWYEAGRFDSVTQGWTTHQSTSAGAFFHTPVGAAGLLLSFDEDGKARLRLMLGSF